MNKLLISVAAAGVLAASSAIAADIPRKGPLPPPPPVFTWTGCHAGVHAGGLWGQTKWTSDDADTNRFTFTQDVNHSTFTGGGHFGCYYQSANNFVIGAEIDASWADVDKFGHQDRIDFDELLRTRFSWYGSARGILGYASGPWLVYATGGVAFGEIRNSYENYVDATLTVLQSRFDAFENSGWTAGGGLAYAWTGNWIVRAEYLYFEFPKRGVEPQIGPPFIEYARTSFHVARLGLSYKFGLPGR